MVRRHRQKSPANRGFALVLAVFLVGLLTVSGVSLALLSATETVRASDIRFDLDHELAVDSFLEFFPALLRTSAPVVGAERTNGENRFMALRIDKCDVHCRIVDERNKLYLGREVDTAQLMPTLKGLAGANGLELESVKLRPVRREPGRVSVPPFLWFDQCFEASRFDAVFHWRDPRTKQTKNETKKRWSELVTFWRAPQRPTYSLLITTSIGNDRRRSYVVVAIANAEVYVLYRSTV